MPGETDDQILVWLPEKKVLCCGDNYYGCFPNLYAIRGSQYRDIAMWLDSLETLRSYPAEYLLPGHTAPIYGNEKIREVLGNFKDAIEYILSLIHISLVESHMFSMELYLQLGGNRISFERFSQDSALFHKYVLSGFDFYKKIYRNKNVEFSGEAVKYLRQRYEELGMHFVETLLEKTAAECTGKVTCRELEPIVSHCREGKDFCDLEQTAKGQIQEMQRKG